MTAGEALRKYTSFLRQHDIDEAVDDAKILLCNVLDLSVSQLFAQSDRPLSDEEIRRMEELLDKRIKRVPTAYLINSRQFYGMDFYIDNRVLIPRPETEVLVEEAIKFSREWCGRNRRLMKIADVGTGSGVIALALAANILGSIVHAIDISEDALKVAGINIKKHELQDRVRLIKGNLLQQNTEKFDMIVANLPYISELELPLLPDEISRYEPGQALNGGVGGTEIIRELIREAVSLVADDGIVLLEIGMGQEGEIMESVKADLPGAQVSLIKDLSCINRVAKIQIASFDNNIGLL